MSVIIGIETSCDETGVGVVANGVIKSNIVYSSLSQHKAYGGVVPEIAARNHIETIDICFKEAIDKASVKLEDIDAIAVTSGPGLKGCLLTGVVFAKGLSEALNKPIYAVNHLISHIAVCALSGSYNNAISSQAAALPNKGICDKGSEAPKQIDLSNSVALLASGGHTSLLYIKNIVEDIEILGETLDDAAGECYDKAARMLGLKYPGGPEISRLAQTLCNGNDDLLPKDAKKLNNIKFPMPLCDAKGLKNHLYNFSFSGLKTAVFNYLRSAKPPAEQIPYIAHAFEKAVTDTLIFKTRIALQNLGAKKLIIAGGVAANKTLRHKALCLAKEAGAQLIIPPLSLCQDNGAMVASLGYLLHSAGKAPSSLDFSVNTSLEAGQIYML